jgi:hypothetical protein
MNDALDVGSRLRSFVPKSKIHETKIEKDSKSVGETVFPFSEIANKHFRSLF